MCFFFLVWFFFFFSLWILNLPISLIVGFFCFYYFNRYIFIMFSAFVLLFFLSLIFCILANLGICEFFFIILKLLEINKSCYNISWNKFYTTPFVTLSITVASRNHVKTDFRCLFTFVDESNLNLSCKLNTLFTITSGIQLSLKSFSRFVKIFFLNLKACVRYFWSCLQIYLSVGNLICQAKLDCIFCFIAKW